MNKNLRPYVISLDWLQLHLHRSTLFTASAQPTCSIFCTNPEDWVFSDAGHGSKTYQHILKIHHQGEPFGEISICPHSKAISELSCTLKIENKVLYEPSCMERVANFLDAFGFKYMGISRIDLAYDCNEFYGGLSASSLMRKYEKGDIIKFGAGSGYRQFKQNYNCSWDNVNKSFALMSDVQIPITRDESGIPTGEFAEELERQQIYSSPECLIKLPDDRNPLCSAKPITSILRPLEYTSTTWGSRSCGHQVQLYNKTLEMQQVKYKHHIAQRWRDYGLDLTRDVWRLEIRVTKAGRLLQNINADTIRFLDPRDIIHEEQLEQIFWDLAWKHFRFLTLDKKDKRSSKGEKVRNLDAILNHKNRLKVYPVLCIAHRNADGKLTEPRAQKFVPRSPSPQKDYSRSVKLAMNLIESAIYSSAMAKNPNIVHLQESYRELSAIYGVHKRNISDIRDFTATYEGRRAEYPIFDFYRREWPELNTKWFDSTQEQRAAIAWARVMGHSKQKVQAELVTLGYSVPLQYVDEALELLLDTGHIPDYMVAGAPLDLQTDTPIEYNPDDLEYSLHWEMLDQSQKHDDLC